jgi:DNA-binding IclR family transcriptional regulator
MKTPSVPALERALAILELLANSRAGLTLPEIAGELRLPKSSVHCLLVTLERGKYLHRNERTSRYLFGSKLFALGNLSLSGLQVRQAAAPHMLLLTERTGLTSHLAILERNEAVLVEKVEPPGVDKLATWLGKRMDLHCTSLGKALIGRLSEPELARMVRETGLPRHNDNSISSLRKLQDDLLRSRELGYYVDDEEDEIGHRCIGAPIHDPPGQVAAAVSISGTTAQVREDNWKALAKEAMRAAAAIARSLAERSAGAVRELTTSDVA